MAHRVLDSSTAITSHRRAQSVLFDIELDDLEGCNTDVAAKELLRRLLSHRSREQLQLLRDAEQAREIALHGEVVDLQAFAEVLASRGHSIWLRTGKSDKYSSHVAFLRHSFVVAGLADPDTPLGTSPGSPTSQPQLFVVDPAFQDSFLLSNATTAYQGLWEELPALFVGTAEQLVAVVEFMCTQMQLVFAETSASCPPWRSLPCMISKWLPNSADDVPVLAANNGGSSAAAADSSSKGNTSASNNAADAERIFAGPAINTLHRSASNSSNNSNNQQGAAGDLLYTPRASKAPYYERNDDSGNMLLSGSLVGLGDGASLLAGGSCNAGDTAFHCFGGDISCIVYSGASSPASWTGKAGYFGAAASWGGAAFGAQDDVACTGGVAIKAAADCSSHSAHQLYRGELGQRASDLRTLSSVGPFGAAAAAAASGAGCSVVGAPGLAPLDISRFNSEVDDVDWFSPRAAKAEHQQQQQGRGQGVHVPAKPCKRRAGGLLSQCSALSAAIAAKAVGRM